MVFIDHNSSEVSKLIALTQWRGGWVDWGEHGEALVPGTV